MAAQGALPVSMEMGASFQAAPKVGKAAKKAAKKQQQQHQQQLQRQRQKQPQQQKQSSAHGSQVHSAMQPGKQSNVPPKDMTRPLSQPRVSADESEEEGEIVEDGMRP